MRRREFLGALGGAAVAWPLKVRAQQPNAVVGWLHGADAQSFTAELNAFRRGLQENGYEEGRNLAIEYQWAEGQFERLPAMARSDLRSWSRHGVFHRDVELMAQMPFSASSRWRDLNG
jgi:hypothetical protein